MNATKEKFIQEITNKIVENIEDIFILLEDEEPIPILENIPAHYKDDPEIMLGIMKANEIGPLLSYCSDRLRADSEFVYEVLKVQVHNFDQASLELQNSKEFVLKCIGLPGFLIEDAPEHFLDDKDCAIAAIKRKGHHALQVISERLKDDKEVAIEAINYQPLCYNYISDRLQYDKDIVLLVLKDESEMKNIPECFTNNKEVMLDFFNQRILNPQSLQNLQYVSDDLKDDLEVVMSAIKQDPLNLQFAGKRFKEDKNLAMLALQNKGSLEFLSEELKNDREVVLLALKNNGSQLQFASNRLKNDKDMVVIACESDLKNIQYASLEIREEIGNNNPIQFIKSQKSYENLQSKVINKEASHNAKIKI